MNDGSDTELARLAADVKALRAELAEMRDRRAIHDCILNYARGIDRHDATLMKSVYHSDAIDNHGKYVARAQDYVDNVIADLGAKYAAHTHCICNHQSDIDGDVAHAESYVIFVTQTKDGRHVNLGGGRYLDRLERRGGTWKIALRRTTVEWLCQANGEIDTAIWKILDSEYPRGAWNKSDLSYARPLRLSPELAAALDAGKGRYGE